MHRSILRSSTTTVLIAALALLVCTTGSVQVINEYLANHTGTDNMSLLLVDGFSGVVGQDLDTDDDGAHDTTLWSAVDDAVAFDAGGPRDHSYAAPVLGDGFDGLPGAPGGASRATDGFDSDSVDDWARNDFNGEELEGLPGDLGPMEAFNTPGFANRRRLEDYYATASAGDPASLMATLHEIIDDHFRHEYTADVTDTWDILDPASEDPNEPLNILDVYKNASYPKAGAGNSNWTDSPRWETWIGRRGDVARAVMYMAVRYEGGADALLDQR